jgi:hypothetical protein
MLIVLEDRRRVIYNTEMDIPEDETEKFTNWITKVCEKLPASRCNTLYYSSKDNLIEIIFDIEKY